MSGGEQQMLTVARTLMGQPLLVLLDEPSEGVAPLIVQQMARTIRALKAQGVSVLLTRRTEQLRHHAGQISFPGGGMDAADADATGASLLAPFQCPGGVGDPGESAHDSGRLRANPRTSLPDCFDHHRHSVALRERGAAGAKPRRDITADPSLRATRRDHRAGWSYRMTCRAPRGPFGRPLHATRPHHPRTRVRPAARDARGRTRRETGAGSAAPRWRAHGRTDGRAAVRRRAPLIAQAFRAL